MIEKFSSKPSWVWLDKLQLVSLENGSAILEPAPGQKEIAAFVSETRRKQIAHSLTELTGQPVRVTLRTSGASASKNTDAEDAPQKGAPRSADRQIAMEMQLVKQALDAFPDATLIDVQRK